MNNSGLKSSSSKQLVRQGNPEGLMMLILVRKTLALSWTAGRDFLCEAFKISIKYENNSRTSVKIL